MSTRNLKVSRLISDRMVLQHGKPVHLWGRDLPGRQVRARLFAVSDASDAVCAETETDATGAWSLFLPAMTAGKQVYRLVIEDDGDERMELHDVLIGAVWFVSGQSNMDLTMERVRDRYPEEIRDCADPCIRTFKIAEHADYHGPLAEPLTGEWRSASPETIFDFSATGYFFAKYFHQATGIPVGFLHASLGGSRIAGWMSRGMLAEATDAAPNGYPELLEEAARYADDAFLASQIAKNGENAAAWNRKLAAAEDERRSAEESPGGAAGTLHVPCFFSDITDLRNFCGEISITRRFFLTEEMIAAAAQVCAGSAPEGGVRLFLGTLVDRDETFVNGVKVGETGYQYPPRKYDVPIGLLHAGENEIEIRLVVEYGGGRFTPGKRYSIFCERKNGKTKYNTGGWPMEAPGGGKDADGEGVLGGACASADANMLWEVDLSGAWCYRVLAPMDAPMPETDFVNWHPTGLYNGMAAPCTFYTLGGFLWYQGEANTHLPQDYEDLQRRLMRGWRRVWHRRSEPAGDAGDPAAETLPFLYVQLPNFRVDLDRTGLAQWEDLRRKQHRCLTEPLSGMIETDGLGDDNDLHPHEKAEIGRRLAALAVEMTDREKGRQMLPA